ncbi:hypothetical protein [Staphylococcus chromogenes]|nr:hypothetical protein [Staphylococcus chromogenes]
MKTFKNQGRFKIDLGFLGSIHLTVNQCITERDFKMHFINRY